MEPAETPDISRDIIKTLYCLLFGELPINL